MLAVFPDALKEDDSYWEVGPDGLPVARESPDERAERMAQWRAS